MSVPFLRHCVYMRLYNKENCTRSVESRNNRHIAKQALIEDDGAIW